MGRLLGGGGGSEGRHAGVDEDMESAAGAGGGGGSKRGRFGASEVPVQVRRKGSGCTPWHAAAHKPCSSF